MKKGKLMMVLLCGFLMVGCQSSTKTSDDTDSKETTTEKKKDTSSKTKDTTSSKTSDKTTTDSTATTQTNNNLVSQYAAGTYCVAVEGMVARTSASQNAGVAYDSFQQGVAVEIVEIKAGDDDSNSVWGRVESPFQGYMCIQDGNGTYLMTQEAYKNSGIVTNASPVTATPDPKDFINRTYKVNVDTLNVRSAASTDGSVVSSLKYGDEVAVQGVKVNDDGSVWALVNEGFACIQDGNGTAYMVAQ